MRVQVYRSTRMGGNYEKSELMSLADRRPEFGTKLGSTKQGVSCLGTRHELPGRRARN